MKNRGFLVFLTALTMFLSLWTLQVLANEFVGLDAAKPGERWTRSLDENQIITITNFGDQANVGNLLPAAPNPGAGEKQDKVKDRISLPPVPPTPQPVDDLPKVSLDFAVEVLSDDANTYIIPKFTGKKPYRKGDVFLVDFEEQPIVAHRQGNSSASTKTSEKVLIRYENLQKVMIPNGYYVVRVYPAAKGLFAVYSWDPKAAKMVTSIQKGYMVSEPWQHEFMVNNRYSGSAAQIMPAHERIVYWSQLKRRPQIHEVEAVVYDGKEKIQPKSPGDSKYPVQGDQTPYPRPGFWLQSFFNPPNWMAKFDGLLLFYQDQSRMEFSTGTPTTFPPPAISPENSMGANHYTRMIRLEDHVFKCFVEYFPGDHYFTNLWAFSWVMDWTPGKERLILGPSCNRRYIQLQG